MTQMSTPPSGAANDDRPETGDAAVRDWSTVKDPVHLDGWIDANRHLFKPPVGNRYLYDGDDFFVMVIGGPNARNDFHMTDSEEFFVQLKGDIVVTIRDKDGTLRDVPVREGETFFIPGGVPHSPQRPPNTVGMVVERRRPVGEIEHLQFYCPKCHALVYDEAFDCKDIVEHFRDAMHAFWADEQKSTCACGYRITTAPAIKRIEFEPKVRIIREGDED